MSDKRNAVPSLYIVIPCYNEEEVLPITSKLFLDELAGLMAKGKVNGESRILFVDDGSTDGTWDEIRKLSEKNAYFLGIRQSRNRGHQNTLLAGLMEAKEQADITISIDCDGQDDVAAMEEMVDAWRDGCEIVYGVRRRRDTDTFFKKWSAQMYYRFLNRMGAEVVYNHADYRLISARALRELEKYKEVNLFLRGMVPMVGFKSTGVYYDRKERVAGRSHYPLSKMFALAFDGITSLSVRPIRLIAGLGVTVSMFSFIGVVWAVVSQLCGKTIHGWASTVCLLCFISGVQLICIGVLGEYIGKIYMEVKARPRYIISERTWQQKEKKGGKNEE